jgi:hypothetical protein
MTNVSAGDSSTVSFVVDGDSTPVLSTEEPVDVVAANSGVVNSVDGSPDPPANQKR